MAIISATSYIHEEKIFKQLLLISHWAIWIVCYSKGVKLLIFLKNPSFQKYSSSSFKAPRANSHSETCVSAYFNKWSQGWNMDPLSK